ncbi:UNVERIFIED_CONTAM: hypothetical protein Slati_2769500 [Sesamum latifolium]|uniref:Transposase n=1 Tax=Sesamum latifolium TaxID=2727402 RepID=A0AAW2VXR6_9LAMI
MCMKPEYMFLTMVIPRPSNSKRRNDVYLEPLIEELLQLWHVGILTHNHVTNLAVMMRAALIWTVNDLPAYKMASGWSTAGIMGCPIYMEDPWAFHLQHRRKACYFDCHRQFLSHNHPYRRNKISFIKNRQERKIARPGLTGDEIRHKVEQYGTAVEEPLTHPPGYGNVHKWTKKNIFWNLLYWNTHLIRHNLDVTHIEKNVFDNIFNTVMDIKKKEKDNLNARKDLKNIHNRSSLVTLSPSPRWDCPKEEVRHFFDKSAGKWLSKKFNEARIRNKQPIWIANDVWASLLEYWGIDEFKKKSTQNKANRLVNPAIANTIYQGGDILEDARGVCLTADARGGWLIVASVTPSDEENFGTRWPGEKAGRVFGMGCEALTSDVARLWIKNHRASTPVSSRPQNLPSQHSFKKSNLCWAYSLKDGDPDVRPHQPPTAIAPAKESMQQQDEEAVDP